MQTPILPIPWREIDTVMLDMDGTLLDLAFDNFFWLELVPAEYARRNGMSELQARIEIKHRYDGVVGRLPWYCVDHWSRELGLDILELKWRHQHRVRYLPMVPEFLNAVRQRAKRLLLVTNAHREAMAVKIARTGLDSYFDALISAHDFDVPKESSAFWPSLKRSFPFDPTRTLLVEDSLAVLRAARDFGVRHTIAVRMPDSGQPAREVADFPAVDGVHELLAEQE